MITDYSNSLIVQEVSPRDGLQIEPTWVETHDKIALIDQLSLAGFSRIEAGSFVSPKAIPALRDGELVFKGITRQPGVIYVALIPNLKGAQRALACRADELNLVMSASQTHNLANMRMRCEDSLAAFGEVVHFLCDSTPASPPPSVARSKAGSMRTGYCKSSTPIRSSASRASPWPIPRAWPTRVRSTNWCAGCCKGFPHQT